MRCIYDNSFISNKRNELINLKSDDETGWVLVSDNDFLDNILDNDKSIVALQNVVCDLMNNKFIQNTGMYMIHWTHQTPPAAGQLCFSNLLLLNKGIHPEKKITVVTTGSGIAFHNNHFENPANDYEISGEGEGSDVTINATGNWWSFIIKIDVSLRIRDASKVRGFPTVNFESILTTSSIIYGSCPTGYILHGLNCYGYKGRVMGLEDARQACTDEGTTLVSAGDESNISDILVSRSGTECTSELKVWLDDLQDCKTLTVQLGTVVTTVQVVNCGLKNAFMCKVPVTNSCPVSCLNHGICIDSVCICNDGWQGNGCASFHCNDVNGCSGEGTCVGPNQCKCNDAWQGDSCDVNLCDPIDTCSDCAYYEACGWCDTTLQCAPGNGDGPISGQCPSWFYYACITIGPAHDCRSNIQGIDCMNNQCNSSTGNSFPGSCTECHDVEHCFNKEPSSCRGWENTLCPGGIVLPDYTDPTRVENTILKSNVKTIDASQAILYTCPTLNVDDEVDNTMLFITKDELDVQTGDIISSIQGDGIMHKILVYLKLDIYNILLGESAQIDDVLQYADFRQELDLIPVEDRFAEEGEISQYLLEELINGDITFDDVDIHVLETDDMVYKCIGSFYDIEIENTTETVKTFHILLSDGLVFDTGDIIVSNHSDGFLEDIVGVDSETNGTFVRTELTFCSTGASFQPIIKTEFRNSRDLSQIIADLKCYGGDGMPGLVVLEKVAPGELEATVGDTIVGRSSNPFIGKVVSNKTIGTFTLIELLEITTTDELFTADVGSLHPVATRKRRATLRPSFQLSFPYVIKSGPHVLTITPKVVFQSTFKFNFKADLWNGITLLGMEFDGFLTNTVEGKYEWKASGSVKGSKNLVDKVLARFILPYVFIPGVIKFVVDVEGSASANISLGTLTGSAGIRTGLKVGAKWTDSYGLQIQKPILTLDPILKGDVNFDDSLKITAGATGAIVPKFVAELPPQNKNLVHLLSKIPWWLKKLLGIKKGTKTVAGISLDIAVPIKAEANATLCQEDCGDPKTPIRFDVMGGVPEVTSDFKAKLFNLFDIKVDVFKKKSDKFVKKHGWCAAFPPCDETTTKPPLSSSLASTWPYTNFTSPYPGSTMPYPGSTPPYPSPTPAPEECECEGSGVISTYDEYGECDCDDCICPPDETPYWVDGVCKCRPKYECGIYPVCVRGRKGSDCSEPDCTPCDDSCSGHGTCVTSNNCSSYCECDSGCTGQCCEDKDGSDIRDPHLRTFDGLKYNFQGSCSYVLVQDCIHTVPEFTIIVKHHATKMRHGHHYAVVYGATIKVGNDEVDLHQKREIVVNNVVSRKTYSRVNPDLIVVVTDTEVNVKVMRHIHVIWDGDRTLHVTIPPKMSGKVCGLLGDDDDDTSDDFRKPDGTMAKSVEEFGNSWLVPGSCV